MSDTQLSSRQIQAVVLIIVMLMGSMIAFALIALPSTDDPVGSRRFGVGSGMIAALAAVWLAKLTVDAVRDRRQGIERGPARASGRFHMWFGAVVALGGIACSVMTHFSAVAAGGGVWTLYYGMILWGAIQMFTGYRRRRVDSDTDAA
jgi:hypothetical protein